MPNETTALARRPESALAAESSYSRDQIELIKRTIAKGATDDELNLFVGTSKRLRLDPFARQIFAIKRWDPDTGQMGMTTHISIDGLRLIADRTEEYLPAPELPVFAYNAKNELVSATVYVLKWRRDGWHRVAAVAYFDEYAGKKKNGELTKNWAEKPHIMLAKCAEALAIRKAFPNETSGVYIPEEFSADELPAEPLHAPPPPPRPAANEQRPAPAPAPSAAAEKPKRVAACGSCGGAAADHEPGRIDASCPRSVTKAPTPSEAPASAGTAADGFIARMRAATTVAEMDVIASELQKAFRGGAVSDDERKAAMRPWREESERIAAGLPPGQYPQAPGGEVIR